MNNVLHAFVRMLVCPFALALVAVSCTAPKDTAPTSTPATTAAVSAPVNVVWILLDACRAENLSCYGYDRQTTPTIDALAAEGVLFEQAYSQSNFTARSVPSYMTGRYFPVSSLALGGRVVVKRIPSQEEVLFPSVARANGYHTELFSGHLAFIRPGCELWQAFDNAHLAQVPPGPRWKAKFEDINADLLPWIKAGPKQPFFAYVHSVDTHFPHDLTPAYTQWIDPAYDTGQLVTEDMGQLFKRRDGQPFTDADKAYLRGLYDGDLRYADDQIKLVLDSLQEAGLRENTLIVIASDHGEALGEDGVTFEHTHAGSSDQVFRVPLILCGPGIPRGVRVPQLVENVDIVPTLIDLLHIQTPARPHGKSLVETMRNPRSGPLRDYVFAYRAGEVHHPSVLYDEDVALFARTDALKFDFDPTSNKSWLWKVPDNLGGRVDLLARRTAEADALKQRIVNERMSLRDDYFALPVRAYEYEGSAIAGGIVNKDAYVSGGDEEDPGMQSDNKWSVKEGYLWCAGWQETPPPLQFAIQVPNGKYNVEITTLSCVALNGWPASSLKLTLEGRPAATITVATLPENAGAFETIDMGEVDITDGALDLSVEKGLEGYWSTLGRITITRAEMAGSKDAGPPQLLKNTQQQEEALRALGYL